LQIAGILIEGIGCVLAGIWGSGTGATTYGQTIGIVGATKVRNSPLIVYVPLFSTFART